MDPPTEDEIKAQEAENKRKKPDPQDVSEVPEMPKSAPPPPPPPEQAKSKPEPPLTSEEEVSEKKDANDKPSETQTPVKSTSTATESSSSGPSLPDGPVSHEERSKQFHELRSYEAKRRTIYTSKMRSTSIYWRAFRDLLSRSYQETDRAENIIRSAVVANKAYAAYLRAAAEDRIDSEGKAVNETRGVRIQADRKKKYSSLGGGSMLMAYGMQPRSTIVEKSVDNSGVSNTSTATGLGISFDNLPEDSLVSELVQMHADMAEKFTENITFVEDVTLAKMIELRKELEAELSVMSVLGDATMYELEKAEEDVQKAWAAYYSLACLADSSALARASTVTDIDPNTVRDVWLVEMHYRMAVAYLTTVWEKSSTELSALFAGVKEMECNRRFRLRELLVMFTQRGERLWDSLPPLVKPVLAKLQETPTEIKTIESNVTEKIREKAKEFQQDDEKNTISTDPLNGPGLAGVPEIRDDFELQSPLASHLLNKVAVIWRKSDKIMAVWKPCLAATTSDGYLHLFDMPASSNVVSGVKAEFAFQALVPPVVVPTEDAIVEGYVPASMARSWFQNLVPSVSFNLKNTNISFCQEKGNSTFEVTEVLAPTKLSKFSKQTRSRKYALRLYSSQDMVDWLLALRELGAA